MLEAEDEDNSSRPMTKFWPRGQLVIEDLTLVDVACILVSAEVAVSDE